MSTAYVKMVWSIGLLGVNAAALAGEPKTAPPQEPAGFVVGGVIGAFAGGPIGAVLGAGLGTWLGNRVHRAAQAGTAETQVASLQTAQMQLESDKAALQGEAAALQTQKAELAEKNRGLTAQLREVAQSVASAQNGDGNAAEVLNGLTGDVLFRTGSAEVSADMAQQIQALARAVAKSPELKIRLDGSADPRGSVDANLKLSEARANAVRDLFVAAGVAQDALEVNAYGQSQSVAADSDGYALERRVRLTLQAPAAQAVAQVDEHE